MNELLLSARMALAAVFYPDPEAWDFLWELDEESTCTERDMASSGESLYSDQDEFIRYCGEIDSDMMSSLEARFSKEEWKILTAKGAWQNGPRLPQVLHLLKYLEDQIANQFDLFDLVLIAGCWGIVTSANGLRRRRPQAPNREAPPPVTSHRAAGHKAGSARTEAGDSRGFIWRTTWMSEKELLNAVKAAEKLKITKRTLLRWARENRIESVKVSRKVVLFTAEAIDDFVKSRAKKV